MTDEPTRTPGECLTLGGHNGNPCSWCGRRTQQRSPAIPKPRCCGGRWNGAAIVHTDECKRLRPDRLSTCPGCAACRTDIGVDERADLYERLVAIVNEQAEDEGLWFVATTAPEAYLQQELRRLHAAIETETK